MPRSLKTGVRLPSWQNWAGCSPGNGCDKKVVAAFPLRAGSLRYLLLFTLRTVNFLKIWKFSQNFSI